MMKRFNRAIVAKSSVFLALIFLFSSVGQAPASTDSTPAQLLFRLEVEEGQGEGRKR